MAPEVTVYTTPPEPLVMLLAKSSLLHSLPLIRRLRFTRLPGGITEHTRILWSSRVSLDQYLATTTTNADSNGINDDRSLQEEVPFAAAYLDFSRGPETELWIYSSMERRLSESTRTQGDAQAGQGGQEAEGETPVSGAHEREEVACAVALLRETKRQQDRYFVPGSARAAAREHPTALVGNLNECLRERLAGAGMAVVSTGLYDKWVFKVDELPDVALPPATDAPGDGDGRRWVWDRVRREDVPFTISRTNIPRRERTMKLLPSTALYLDDGTPVAWAYLGPDSSLSSLHCEEPFRGRGIAKAVAVRVLRDHLKEYSDDPYGWADVAPDNTQSRSVCRSLNGHPMWQISWSRLNLDESFPDE
ncbi:hypothetical protein F4825DRAFT_125577 [Nemania diffusa]|nr:hypothetical protein F4825DRAFT_125577 [Nemania diffusa]